MPLDSPFSVTVYPSTAGGFPPASFWDSADSLDYIRHVQEDGAPCGLCECPADSYEQHFRVTVRN